MATTTPETRTTGDTPDITISVRQTFGIDSNMQVPAFSAPSEHVPDIDEAYRFDHDTTLAILADILVRNEPYRQEELWSNMCGKIR